MAESQDPLEKLRDTAIRLVNETASVLFSARHKEPERVSFGDFQPLYRTFTGYVETSAWKLMADANPDAVSQDGVSGESCLDIVLQLAKPVEEIRVDVTTLVTETSDLIHWELDCVRAASRIRNLRNFDAPLLCARIKKEYTRARRIAASRVKFVGTFSPDVARAMFPTQKSRGSKEEKGAAASDNRMVVEDFGAVGPTARRNIANHPVRASAEKLFPKGEPKNRDVVELVIKINTEKGGEKSLNQIARAYTRESKGSDRRAQQLLSTIRRLRREGRVNY